MEDNMITVGPWSELRKECARRLFALLNSDVMDLLASCPALKGLRPTSRRDTFVLLGFTPEEATMLCRKPLWRGPDGLGRLWSAVWMIDRGHSIDEIRFAFAREGVFRARRWFR